ncbi:PKD domain-containing protein [Pseudofrankia inefficax]|uniref:PKD domain containing protein n=1 Tax=Pseudofrankia inefficax (strain DSM 45817 / CECT 9037 / DDB 130130 / EuI1c) TaxID=298654 RepID=E3JBA5_PSEI1|nr:PKD domain-containing protein [Pseudofrankia inefficax]ADP78635.1 PKD domain containing protein [Pseudofrankia inefficax]
MSGTSGLGASRVRHAAGPALRWAPRLLLAVLVLAGACAVIAGNGAGAAARSVSLEDSAAWLLSPTIGETELVDGNTGAVITRVTLGAGQLAGAQSGADEVVADTGGGTVRRVDGATYRVSAAVRPGRPGEPLTVYPTKSTLFIANRTTGLVTAADPERLTTRYTASLSARMPVGGVAADGNTGLWAIDATTGDLAHVGPSGTTIRRHAVDPAHTQLVTAAGRAVAVDLTAGRAVTITASGGGGPAACVDTAVGDTTVSVVPATSAEQVYVTSGQRGVLLISDLATGRCGRAIDLGVAGHRLGQAVETARRLFVPDYTTGQVIVADLASGRVIASPTVLPPGTLFELASQGSITFFNDPSTARAGIISLDGTVRAVQKYDAANPGSSAGGHSGSSGPSGGSDPLTAADVSGPTGPVTPGPTPTPTTPVTGRSSVQPSNGPATVGGSLQTAVPLDGRTPAAAAPGARIEVSAPRARMADPLTLHAVLVGANGQVSDARITSTAWTFGDGATGGGVRVSHAWAAAGTYQVGAAIRLRDGTSTAASTVITITAQAPPITGPSTTPVSPPPSSRPTTPPTTPAAKPKAALFAQQSTPSSGQQVPLEVAADATGSSGSGALRYTFDFGDGTAAVGPQAGVTARHDYAATGTYPVRLTVTDATGATDAVEESVLVAPAGAAWVDVRPDSGQGPPLTATADASASSGTGTLHYTFSFGDGSASVGPQTGATVTHTYTAPGQYALSVTVTDAVGGKYVNSSDVVVDPVWTVTPSSGPAPLTVEAQVVASQAGATYDWGFGDGTPGTGWQTAPTATHTYTAPGTYQVFLEFQYASGAFGTRTMNVTVTGPAAAPG